MSTNVVIIYIYIVVTDNKILPAFGQARQSSSSGTIFRDPITGVA